MAGPGFQLRRRAVGNHFALGDDHGARADRVDFFQHVRGQDDGLFVRHGFDEPAHFMFLVGIEPVGGFVENQHGRIMHDGLGQAYPAFESLGKGVDGLVRDSFEIHFFHGLRDPAIQLRSTKPAHFTDEHQKIQRRHLPIGRGPFRQVAEALFGFERLFLHVEAVDLDGAASWGQKPGNHFHGRGFTRAVRSQKSQHLAPTDRERHVFHGRDRPERFPKLSQFNHRVHCLLRSRFRVLPPVS